MCSCIAKVSLLNLLLIRRRHRRERQWRCCVQSSTETGARRTAWNTFAVERGAALLWRRPPTKSAWPFGHYCAHANLPNSARIVGCNGAVPLAWWGSFATSTSCYTSPVQRYIPQTQTTGAPMPRSKIDRRDGPKNGSIFQILHGGAGSQQQVLRQAPQDRGTSSENITEIVQTCRFAPDSSLPLSLSFCAYNACIDDSTSPADATHVESNRHHRVEIRGAPPPYTAAASGERQFIMEEFCNMVEDLASGYATFSQSCGPCCPLERFVCCASKTETQPPT